jgi:signal peptidase I
VASAAGLAVLAFGHWVIRPSYVPSGSMAPTIAIGDRVLVDRVGFQLTGVERGDIVVFDHDEDGRHDEFVKRVIALGGDRVECRSGRLYRNGGELDEPYLSRQGVTQCDSLTVPDGGVFVLGDDRDVSRDSRAFGAVPARDVVGRVLGTVPFTIPATPVL